MSRIVGYQGADPAASGTVVATAKHFIAYGATDDGIDMFIFVQSGNTKLPELRRITRNGDVPMARIDDAVSRILRMKLRLDLFESPLRPAAAGQRGA